MHRYRENAFEIAAAAAAAHGMLCGINIDPVHHRQAKRIVNEIADLLWPGDADMRWKERADVEG